MRFIWLSDCHYLTKGTPEGHDPRVRLQAAVDHISTHHADAEFCLISGDLSEDASIDSYRSVARILAGLPMPVYPMVGNHDDRANLRAVFDLPKMTAEPFVQYAIEARNSAILCLDTLTPGSGDGSLCPARLEWLHEALLKNRDRSVIVAMHHPPMPLGFPMLDPSRIAEGDELLNILEGAPNVVQLLFGHVHRMTSGVVRGVPFASARAVLYQAPQPRPAWDWDSFQPALEPPGLMSVHVTGRDVTIHHEQFCAHALGVGQETE